MKGNLINREMLEGITRSSNSQFIDTINDKVFTLISLAIEELSKNNPFVSFNNVILQPVNEVLTGGLTDISPFIYFLGIDSAQLEINTLTNTVLWKKWKDKIVYAWKHRKDDKKRKRKKKKKDEPEPQYIPKAINPEKYNILSLSEDLTYAFANQLSQTSMVYNEGKRIRIIGKEDIGSNTQIFIYPVLYNGSEYKYFIDSKQGFLPLDIDFRIQKIDEKAEQIGGEILKNLIKLFNVIYYNANKCIPNQIFVESILCACPNNLFTSNATDSFINIINYLTMIDIKQIPSLINPDKTIFTDKICGNNLYGYRKMVDQLIEMK